MPFQISLHTNVKSRGVINSFNAGTDTYDTCAAEITLTATVDGSLGGHTILWEQVAGNTNAYHTLPPMTVTSSGTGYVVPLGSVGTSDGRYDPNFLFVESDAKSMNVSMDGTPVAVKLSNVKTAPAPGEVVIASMHGDLICNAADVGKTITGSFIYSTK